MIENGLKCEGPLHFAPAGLLAAAELCWQTFMGCFFFFSLYLVLLNTMDNLLLGCGCSFNIKCVFLLFEIAYGF